MEDYAFCPCGAPVARGDRPGRPRRFCTDCRPPKPKPVSSKPRVRFEACDYCAAPSGGARFCGQACKDSAKRDSHGIPCDVCGFATWVMMSSGQPSARHKGCLPPLVHGTMRAYRVEKCRCVECVLWNRRTHQAYRDQLRASGRKLRRYGGGSGYWVAASVRDEVFERDAWTCQLCYEPLQRDAHPNSDWFPSVDHIVPASKGGPHTVENLRAAHRWCNSIRGAEDHHSDLFQEA